MQQIERILIAPDKFKGSLNAMEVCQAVAQGIAQVNPGIHLDLIPMADGGDGSVAILAPVLGLQEVRLAVEDPLGRPIEANYYHSRGAAYVEMATASGLVLLSPEERDPKQTSSFGTGMLIRHAIDNGLQQIFLFLGGSATNDGGMGLAEALGFTFLGPEGERLRGQGSNLRQVRRIIPPNEGLPAALEVVCLCDVQNPLIGESGATRVYAPQKGASPEEVDQLEKGMFHFAEYLQAFAGKDISAVPGGGAAGGIAAGLQALCGAKIRSGIAAIQAWVELESRIQLADLVITGEGKLDSQTFEGKVVDGVLSLAAQHAKKTLLVVGGNELTVFPYAKYPFPPIVAIMDKAPDVDSAMKNAASLITLLVAAYFNKEGL